MIVSRRLQETALNILLTSLLGGMPFSNFIGKVSSKNKVPVNATLVVTALAALLTLIYIGSYTAFNDVISLTITGFYGSYFLPSALLLYRRIKGEVLPFGTEIDTLPPDAVTGRTKNGAHSPQDQAFPGSLPDPSTGVSKKNDDMPPPRYSSGEGHVEVVNARLIWGPWHLPGIIGIANNIYACCYMIFVIFWSCWPPDTPVSAATMNYSVVVTGGVLILSTIWYFVRGKREYKGPLIDEEVAQIMRAGSVVSVS